MSTTIPSSGRGLVPDPKVAKRYGRHPRTIARWDQNPELGFPRPVVIRNRKYRIAEELDAFDRRLADARPATDDETVGIRRDPMRGRWP